MKAIFILFTLLSGLACMLQIFSAAAQTTTVDGEEVAIDQAITSLGLAEQNDGVLRLQDTIRGNKEQPQVLSIVPWQLPTHKRIDATTEWQPIVNKMAPIERSQFLRELRLFDAENRSAKALTENTEQHHQD